ncbi:MAG TPA: DUF4105 domain-containing protein [Bacteroidales bacterium]|nr:DUF4105 domain-containing protein [Bacteroidales bacterium]HPI68916.1 DUF4105 domain-containing protein [Bacteroidales bacterium]HPR72282.1 DUF4105 domain-containing protein [Bacteroidales bacterium]
MKKVLLGLVVMLFFSFNTLKSQTISPEIRIFLITCGPGTETYSMYGHSAIRVLIPENNTDIVYNWGVFDFEAPHFVWKFARGRLNYMLAATTFDNFREEYLREERWMDIQEINLDSEEKIRLLQLINENIKPENAKYLYDFFYDNCSTRIRDLIEKVTGNALIYPPDDSRKVVSYRNMARKYHQQYAWLNLGIDLLLGTPSEKKADMRGRMFLPVEMQEELSDAVVRRSGKMIPLLSNPKRILDFDTPQNNITFFSSPLFVFSVLTIVIFVFYGIVRNRTVVKAADIVFFSFFSLLALLMIFANFFTDHSQLKWNLNIIWLSPFVVFCLLAVIMNKKWYFCFRAVFFLCIAALLIQVFFSQGFNTAFMPLILILAYRSSAYSGIAGNPLSVESF